MSSKVKFTNTNKSEFFATARQRVEAYFKDNQVAKHGNTTMWTKAFIYLGSFLTLYLLIIFNFLPVWAMFILALALGVSCAFIGFNVCHDAIHGSFSGNPRVNKFFSFIFNLIGASPYIWSITHNVVHHTYTNIFGHDEDIDIAPGLVRISAEEKVNKIQRYSIFTLLVCTVWYRFRG